MFIGRQDELQFLNEQYATKEGCLVVLYGRRRVGKTEMLRKFCEDKEHVFYTCTENTDEFQLAAFSGRMLQKAHPAARYINRFAEWGQALSSIVEFPSKGKKLLVIDEFPYMVKANPAIPSILLKIWDEGVKDRDVMIVLCGSAMSFIEKEILSEKNPLYGRATGIIKLNEMTFFEAVQFVPNYDPLAKITAYAVLGGIPHYLKQFDDAFSLDENIQRKILSRGSILYSEVEFLMRQEMRETAIYNAIIGAVALGNTKLGDIHQKTGIEKTKLSAYLRNLMDLNIIVREFPVFTGVKEYANIHRGLYQVADNFFRFWYAFVLPNLSELETGDSEGIWAYAVEPTLNAYTSRVFEDVCRQFLRAQNRRSALPFHFTAIGRWWDKVNEIDIVATGPDRQNFIIGECKYRSEATGVADLSRLKEKSSFVKQGSKAWYVLFSKSGFTEELLRQAKEDESLNLYTPEDIVNLYTSEDIANLYASDDIVK